LPFILLPQVFLTPHPSKQCGRSQSELSELQAKFDCVGDIGSGSKNNKCPRGTHGIQRQETKNCHLSFTASEILEEVVGRRIVDHRRLLLSMSTTSTFLAWFSNNLCSARCCLTFCKRRQIPHQDGLLRVSHAKMTSYFTASRVLAALPSHTKR
jgi:hypothetical protein